MISGIIKRMRFGMICKPGELVGIPFPYSDLSANKRRSVLVITNPDQRGDFMGCAVTSVLTRDFAISIDEKSMSTGILPRLSWIRFNKIFTLNNSIIVITYGLIKEEVFQNVISHLCNYIGCISIM
jgi:mRNA interferase MazF